MQINGFHPGAYALEVTMPGSAPAVKLLTLP
jgi:hypothetical protein